MTLELQNISKMVRGQTHIYPTDLTLEAATMNVLLGPTLSGKTSLMRLMAGLDQPATGRILWNGQDVTGMRVQDRAVAMVYQQFINYPSLSVFENIASPLRLQGKDRAEITRLVHETADLLKLTPMLDRRPLELSGGQQQRTALARALVKSAGLVLLDEPLGNLDYKLREELRAEIPRIFAESGAIFVYATTEPEEALLLGGNTATLWEGRITQFGPTPEVYRRPADATTARVFSDPPMNFLDLEKRDGELHLSDASSHPVPAEFAALADGRYRAGFRPAHLSLAAPQNGALHFEAVVGNVEITGSESFVHVGHAGVRWVALTHGVHEAEVGSQISVHVEPRHIYLFAPDGALAQSAAYAAEL